MSIIPKVKLFQSDGSTLVYTFPAVNSTNAPQSPVKTTFIEGIRGIGGILVKGSIGAWDLILKGTITGTDYEDIVTKMDAMVSAIPVGDKFVVKIDKDGSNKYEYNAIRIEDIEWGDSLRISFVGYTIKLKCNSW